MYSVELFALLQCVQRGNFQNGEEAEVEKIRCEKERRQKENAKWLLRYAVQIST